jgi:hypothetical protein
VQTVVGKERDEDMGDKELFVQAEEPQEERFHLLWVEFEGRAHTRHLSRRTY